MEPDLSQGTAIVVDQKNNNEKEIEGNERKM